MLRSHREIDFGWSAGNIIEVAEPPVPSGSTSAAGTLVGGAVAPGFDDAAHALGIDLAEMDRMALLIRQKGSFQREVRPLESRPTLYLVFAQLDRTPEACRDFAQAYGFLGVEAKSGAAENFSAWLQHIRAMWLAVDRLKRGEVAAEIESSVVDDFAQGTYSLRPTQSGLALVFRPRSLLAALWLQYGFACEAGAKISNCKRCGHWFEAGTGKRRADSDFCSVRCRAGWHNEKARLKRLGRSVLTQR